ncbi:MAG: SUMF1/EgtB/PvdO family nonheme iron enzyme [Nitrospinae bacterium]|nr:SUMF1/EgtB/PvdO family nonheme iron enzyme [Nitrospinota bacterium]
MRGRRLATRTKGSTRPSLITVAALCSLALVTWPVAADLDPAIQADLHLVQAEDFIKQKNYAAAQEAMKKILALQEKHDLNIPAEFHFKYAQVLDLAGHYEEAVAAVTEYLKIAGRGGSHYREALSLLHTATQRLQAPAVAEQFRDCAACPEMVVVPAGSYVMGSPSSEEGRYDHEGPQHRVTISESFAVGAYEVTFEEWDACVSAGGCGGYGPDDGGSGRGRRPVINVNWDDVQRFVAWLRIETGEPYRLLSEAEWEYVARAGTTTARYWGETESGQCRHANGADQTAKKALDGRTVASCDDGHAPMAPTGTYVANNYGLYDLLGNVWEWVEDCANDSYRGAPVDGSAWESGKCSSRVIRGGSWFDEPRSLRSASREWGDTTGYRGADVGFRVARTLTP